MKDSIVINMKYADYDMLDGTPEDGLWVPLTPEHHEGKMSVHMNKEMKVLMHIIGQLAYEKHCVADGMTESEARETFRKRYGKSYL